MLPEIHAVTSLPSTFPPSHPQGVLKERKMDLFALGPLSIHLPQAGFPFRITVSLAIHSNP